MAWGEKGPESAAGGIASDPQSQLDVCAEAFNSVADRYDDDFTNRGEIRTLRQAVLHRLRTSLRPPRSSLDAGCGTGGDAPHLARAGSPATCTDSAPPMLQLAQHKPEA